MGDECMEIGFAIHNNPVFVFMLKSIVGLIMIEKMVSFNSYTLFKKKETKLEPFW